MVLWNITEKPAGRMMARSKPRVFNTHTGYATSPGFFQIHHPSIRFQTSPSDNLSLKQLIFKVLLLFLTDSSKVQLD